MSDSNGTLLEFCPKCQTLLITEKDDTEVLLKCNNCEYTKEITTRHTIHSNKHKDDHANRVIPYSTIYDDAVKRTTRVICKNSDCPSLNLERWGTVTENGIKVEPNVIVSTVYDPDKIATYICRICGHIFRP